MRTGILIAITVCFLATTHSIAKTPTKPTAHAVAEQVPSKTVEGIEFPGVITEGTEKLVLNGVGIRTATFLKIKAYVAGLYLLQRSADAEGIVNSSTIRKLNIHFVRNVSADKIRKSLKEGVENNCENLCEKLAPSLEQLNSAIEDFKEGDILNLVFHKDYILAQLGQDRSLKIEGEDFAKTILAIWLGKKPLSDSLKNGLLGK